MPFLCSSSTVTNRSRNITDNSYERLITRRDAACVTGTRVRVLFSCLYWVSVRAGRRSSSSSPRPAGAGAVFGSPTPAAHEFTPRRRPRNRRSSLTRTTGREGPGKRRALDRSGAILVRAVSRRRADDFPAVAGPPSPVTRPRKICCPYLPSTAPPSALRPQSAGVDSPVPAEPPTSPLTRLPGLAQEPR